ncbi:MAG: pilin N-terminal domain-containing protein [Finegoldia magna]|uniref:pilin N-terminal domain-containing protein n=1 Tax=Finegoldia magna TaxID=1260 RepID=UPI0039A38D8C
MKKRFLSLIIALAMMVGVFTPLLTSAADGKTETVTLHKLMMDKATLDAWDFNQVEKDGYNGTQNLDQLKALNSLAGKDIKEIPNVYFALKFAADYKDATKAGKYVKADAADKLKPVEPLEATDNIDEAVGGLTTPNGVVFKTSALEGNFEMDEIHEKSTYKGENGETLTDMKAVPVKITLPLVNDKGVVPNAHVYPKNTEEKPDTHKDFTKEFTTEQPNGRTDEQKNEAAAEPHNVGDVIDYTVTTKVPAKTKWKTAFWDDKMTEGLTFIQRKDNADKGITVKYDGNVMDASWYELDETENGFTLKLTDTGLSEIAKATEVKEIRLDYHATVNEKAVVAIPESNDVSFHYGNHKDHGTTPVPNKPNDNGELTVTKNWDTGVAKKDVEFTLYNAQTGKIVEAKDVEAVKGYEFKNPVTIPAGDTMSYTWKGLNKNIEYKVEEKYNEYSAEYKKGDAGQITVKNYNDENPKPINPTEPKVVTYGAKFVKTDAEGKRLPGAEFVIRNADKKFLTGTDADRTAYETAQKAYEDAIKAYNALEAAKQTKDERAKIAKLEKARDDAWNATLKDMTQWNGATKDDTNNIRLTSNELGQFEIAGLAPGKYTLVEVKSPEGYALPTNAEFEFEIKADGTLTVMNIDFGVKDDDKADNALQVINKKVTIPQTGGIGTIIFTAIGLAIMASAIIAIKKRQATEAR